MWRASFSSWSILGSQSRAWCFPIACFREPNQPACNIFVFETSQIVCMVLAKRRHKRFTLAQHILVSIWPRYGELVGAITEISGFKPLISLSLTAILAAWWFKESTDNNSQRWHETELNNVCQLGFHRMFQNQTKYGTRWGWTTAWAALSWPPSHLVFHERTEINMVDFCYQKIKWYQSWNLVPKVVILC
jgi:hypothetical protein